MSARGGPRKPRAKKGASQISLPAPRPLYGLQADLYELLVVDLEQTIEARLKADKRVKAGTQTLAAALKREQKLRDQLATFAPALDGFEHDAQTPAEALADAYWTEGQGDAPSTDTRPNA
jgi:hypothetical protein